MSEIERYNYDEDLALYKGDKFLFHLSIRDNASVAYDVTNELLDLQSQLAAATRRVEALEAEVNKPTGISHIVSPYEKKVKALQAENARLVEVMIDLKDSLATNYHDFYHKAQRVLYSLNLTPQAPEQPEAPMWCPVEHPIHSDKYTVKIMKGDDYQYDTFSYVNPYEFEEDAWHRADELNGNES